MAYSDQRKQQDFKFLDELIASTGASSLNQKDDGSAQQTLDIRAYTQQIKSELSRLEDDCTVDFMNLNNEAVLLYNDINQSEQILCKVENVVDGFQGELERISDEVRNLQQRSESYHMQLKNRRNLNKMMTKYLDNTLLTKDMIDALCNQDIDKDLESYLQKVEQLNEMIFYVQNPPTQIGQNSKSLQKIKPEIEKLKFKVCSRAYKFLLAKMNNLRKPNTNFQIYQESILLKYKALVSFLRIHNQEVFQELCEKYCEIMNNLYSTKLHDYFKETWKLVYFRITKNDVLFHNENQDPAQAGINAKMLDQCMSQLTQNQVSNNSNQQQNAQDDQQMPQHRQVFVYDITDRLDIFQIKKKSDAYQRYGLPSQLLSTLGISDSMQIDMSASMVSMGSDTLRQMNSQRSAGAKPNEEQKMLHDDRPIQIQPVENMPLFVDDPIVAHMSKTRQHKHLIEEIFRSQMKLISDTIAKEFTFILDFFDFKISNKTQQTFMFNKIFRQIITKYYFDKLKENCDWQLFDIYSCLIMIQINEECREQMQKVYRINVLDNVLDKISIYVLWPRFSYIFNMHVDNIKKCEPKIFKLYNQPYLHPTTTVRCFQFLAGLYKLNDYINPGGSVMSTDQNQNNMLRQRYNRLLEEILKLMKRMAVEHFAHPKEQGTFMINNLDFVVTNLVHFQLKRSKQDIVQIQKTLENEIDSLIKVCLQQNFMDLCNLSSQFIPDENSEEKLTKEDLLTPERLQNLNPADLEKIGKDFMKNYKQKTENIIKDFRSNIQQVTQFNKDVAITSQDSKKAQSSTKKELVTRLVRILQVHFTTYIEIIKTGQFQSQYLKQISSNTTQLNQVLLDLKNCATVYN